MKNFRVRLNLLIICFLVYAASACSINQIALTEMNEKSNASDYEALLEKGRGLVRQRQHQKAIILFDKAGVIDPNQPEWLYEKARALFYMDQFPESITACEHAFDRDPSFYDAKSLSWAVRLVVEKSSEQTKKAVRKEIEDLLNEYNEKTGVLMAAFEGYQWLKDRQQEQKLITVLAKKAGAEDQKTREMIATRLFEQIIKEKDDKSIKIVLLEAYIYNFPQQRYAEYAAFLLLKTKKELAGDNFEMGKAITTLLNLDPQSYQVKTGVALWLIENDQDPQTAVHLLQQSQKMSEQNPQKKPQFFEPGLWEKELEKQKDKIHLMLGRAWFNFDDHDNASKEFHQVIANKRPWSDAYYYLAKIALKDGNKGEAIENFCHSLELRERKDDANEILTKMLAEEYGFEGNTAEYFSDIENTICFSDVTEAAGLGDVKGERVAWGDYNHDGLDDLLVNGSRLFENSGDGVFIDCTRSAGLDQLKKVNGGIWGDYNNDGLLDIFITGRTQNYLVENIGKGIFVDRTELFSDKGLQMQTEAAAWGDLDNDGFLDLYVANYESWGVMRAIGNHDRLYKNVNGIRFEDITYAAEIITDEAMCGRGVTWSDINFDGFQDIIVANYRLDPNFLWMNNQSELTESAEIFGIRGYETDGAFGHSIGAVSGDLDNDGDLDVFISNLAHPRYIEFSDVNMMLMNQGFPEYTFSDHYTESGILFEETNADPALADIDNDGDLDLYLTSIYSGRYSHLYLNDGSGAFTDSSWISGIRVENSWGTAFSDFNNDGFVDLVVASTDGIRLFKNNGNSNHWISVRIFDKRCNRSGIGSKVTVKYGDKQQIREVTAGKGSGSQDSLELIFGLGEYSGPVEVIARTLCGDLLQKVVNQPDQNVILTH